MGKKSVTIYNRLGMHKATDGKDVEPKFEFFYALQKATDKTGRIDICVLEEHFDKPPKIIREALKHFEMAGYIALPLGSPYAQLTSYGRDTLPLGKTLVDSKDLERAGMDIINTLLENSKLAGDIVVEDGFDKGRHTGVHPSYLPTKFDREKDESGEEAFIVTDEGRTELAVVDRDFKPTNIDDKIMGLYGLDDIRLEALLEHGYLKKDEKDLKKGKGVLKESTKGLGSFADYKCECGSTHFQKDEERAEVSCSNCGLVIDDNLIDHNQERRIYDHEQRLKRSRSGPPLDPLLHDFGLGSSIGYSYNDMKDIYGNSIPSEQRALFYRLRKWQKRIRIRDSRDRALAQGLNEIKNFGSRLDLPVEVQEDAAYLYRHIVNKGNLRGRTIDGIADVLTYLSARMFKVPRTMAEAAKESFFEKKKEFGKSYRFAKKVLDIKPPLASPFEFVPRICSKLDLSEDPQSEAFRILKKAVREVSLGRSPLSYAAAASYIASVLEGNRRTQVEFAHAAGVTEVTIRNTYKELCEKLNINLPRIYI